MSAHLTLGRAAMQADAALRAAAAADRDDDSPPPSPPRLSGRHSCSAVSENEPPPLPLEDIAALVTTSRNAAASAATPSTKPKLAVSASGRFQDQFYHAQEASRTVGLIKNRAIVKQSADGNRSDAPPKRKKSINVNGRDVEQFSDSDIIYSGYLVKQGSFWKTWKRRYFILRRDVNVLAYYTSQENLVKLGEVTIDGTTKITPPNPADKAFPGRFTVEHNERKLVLVAEDRSAADTWTMVLKRCVNTRAQEAEAAAAAARGTSELETMRSSLMQLRLSANDSLLGTKRHSGSGLVVAPAASVDSPRLSDVERKKLPPQKPPAPPASNGAAKAQLTESKSEELPPPPSVEETPSLSKVKRHSTDSRVIQAAADEAAMMRAKSVENTERERIVRTARLKSIDSANDTGPKKRSSSKEIGSVGLKPRRLFRSYSAGSVLSTRSIGYDDVRFAHDDCGLRTSPMTTNRNNHPSSNKQLRSSEGQLSGIDTDNSKGTTRARNLSLPSFRPVPSVELSVSVGSRGTQDISHMIVVLSAIFPEERGNMKELGRTEVQGSLALRPCGADFYVRDFSSLLSVPLSGVRNAILQFEIFAVLNLSTEALTYQLSLGFVRISHVDLLFSGDSTLVLECVKPRTSPSKQYHFLTVDRIRPSESLNLGHSYLYAKRHFVADIVPFDLRQGSSSDFVAVLSSPDNGWSTGDRRPSQANTSPTQSAPVSSSRGSTLSYSDMMRGNVDSTEASQIFISEELSSSYCSISVAAKYMNLVQLRNQRRIHDAKILISDIERKYEQMPSSPNSRTECGDIINVHLETIRDAEERVAHYTKLYKAYVECEDYYDVLLAMLEDGKEPGITGCLKRSTQKKDKRTEFMPTNLNCHVVRARRVVLSSISNNVKDQGTREKNTGAKGDELVYAVITHGCPAAHCVGFKEGGLRRLQQTLAQGKDDRHLIERIEQRQDVVRCQILAIASAAFLTVIGLAANQSARHQERLQLMCRTGFLLSMESLLSTIKNEKGMIEDMVAGVQWLNDAVSLQVVQSLEENPKLKCAKCIGITSSESGNHVVATFALPTEVYSALPDILRQGHALKVYAVMFTQGINEMQSVANTVFDTSLQDEINYESATRLVRYFDTYKKHVMEMQPQNPERIKDLPDLEIEIKILAEKLNLARKSHVQKKNVNILIESSDLCRRLGAGRSTCCKSGKDRTAMSVTLECSRLLVDKFHVKQGVHLTNAMRERGVRRINVLANTGKNKFAFNNFQLKYLPDCYRPPVLTADSGVQS